MICWWACSTTSELNISSNGHNSPRLSALILFQVTGNLSGGHQDVKEKNQTTVHWIISLPYDYSWVLGVRKATTECLRNQIYSVPRMPQQCFLTLRWALFARLTKKDPSISICSHFFRDIIQLWKTSKFLPALHWWCERLSTHPVKCGRAAALQQPDHQEPMPYTPPHIELFAASSLLSVL